MAWPAFDIVVAPLHYPQAGGGTLDTQCHREYICEMKHASSSAQCPPRPAFQDTCPHYVATAELTGLFLTSSSHTGPAQAFLSPEATALDFETFSFLLAALVSARLSSCGSARDLCGSGALHPVRGG